MERWQLGTIWHQLSAATYSRKSANVTENWGTNSRVAWIQCWEFLFAFLFFQTTDTFTFVVTTLAIFTMRVISRSRYMFLTWLPYQEVEGMVVNTAQDCASTFVSAEPLDVSRRPWDKLQLCLRRQKLDIFKGRSECIRLCLRRQNQFWSRPQDMSGNVRVDRKEMLLAKTWCFPNPSQMAFYAKT